LIEQIREVKNPFIETVEIIYAGKDPIRAIGISHFVRNDN